MKAIVCDVFGPVEKLDYREVENPKPASDEVLVNIRAAGVNFPDGLLVQGLYQVKPECPFTPGNEFAGEVAGLGEGVTQYKVGDKVIGLSTNFGAYAEQICCPAERLMPMPSSMDFAEASALVLATGTAHHALRQRARLQPGETLLVLGAAGGTGTAAVQIGKAMGARVIAGCSSDEKLAHAQHNGADELINYSTEDLKTRVRELTKGKGVDVVYDPVGGELFDICARSMAPNGRLLVIGFASGTIPSLPVNLALVKEYAVVGVFWGTFTRREPDVFAQNMKELYSWYEQGKVSLHIDDSLPLSQASQALERVLSRQVKGKVVLLP